MVFPAQGRIDKRRQCLAAFIYKFFMNNYQ